MTHAMRIIVLHSRSEPNPIQCIMLYKCSYYCTIMVDDDTLKLYLYFVVINGENQ